MRHNAGCVEGENKIYIKTLSILEVVSHTKRPSKFKLKYS